MGKTYKVYAPPLILVTNSYKYLTDFIDGIVHNSTDAMFPSLAGLILKEVANDGTFLDLQRRLVLMERNPVYADKMALKLAFDMGVEFLDQIEQKYVCAPFPHHNGRGAVVFTYKNTELSHPVKEIVARTKSVPSLIEKMSRGTLEVGKGMVSKIDPRRPFVSDLYALTVVTETKEVAEELSYFNRSTGRLLTYEHDNIYESPRNYSSYKAIHDDAVWFDNDPLLNGLRVEIHYVAQEDRKRNLHGESEDDVTSHSNYARTKIKKPHSFEGYQVVVVSHDTLLSGLWGSGIDKERFRCKEVSFGRETGLNMVEPIKYNLFHNWSNLGGGLNVHGKSTRGTETASTRYA